VKARHKLSDAASRAVWKRMGEGPFARSELVNLAVAAGESRVGCLTKITAAMNEMKAKGAIYYSGPPNGGRWHLLPRDKWAGAPIPRETPKPEIKAPPDSGVYDPAAEVEGPNNGLTTAFAEHLWHDLGAGDRSYALKSLAVMEQRAWREAAERALNFLFGIGFVGPAGTPREPHTGWTYKWLYEAGTWEIADEDGGYVAMVGNDSDVPLLLAAPDMATAIKAAVTRYREAGGIKRSDIDDLTDSLPKTGFWALPPEGAPV
jgi:hypothetical protein